MLESRIVLYSFQNGFICFQNGFNSRRYAEAGYSAAYSQLHNAARKEVDPCADVADAKVNLPVKLAGAAAQRSSPGG